MTTDGLDLCDVCDGRGGDPEVNLIIRHDHGEFPDVEVRLCKHCVAEMTLTMVKIFNRSRRADRAEVAAMKKMFGMEDDT